MLPKFLIVKKNKFDNPQYIESNDGEHVQLNTNVFWSIKNPSIELQKYLNENCPNWKIYMCSAGTFALSHKASTAIKSEGFGQGALIILKFKSPVGDIWNLLVADNKIYVQPVQGSLDENESPVMGIVREAMEEVKIDLSKFTLIPVASYSFTGGNELVDCKWKCMTTCFVAFLQWDMVKHLFPNGLVSNQINIINASKLNLDLD